MPKITSYLAVNLTRDSYDYSPFFQTAEAEVCDGRTFTETEPTETISPF